MNFAHIPKHYIRPKTPLFKTELGLRLPLAYKKFYDEWKNTLKEPVHYIPEPGKWKKDETTGKYEPIINVPIHEKQPKEFKNYLTGGEALIQGYEERKYNRWYSGTVSHFWTPKLYRSVIYSEILNVYLSIIMTSRAEELIHKNHGLDNYLLRTKACDLETEIALKLKKKLLEALSTKNLPYDEETNASVYQKYEPFLLPPEEIEWYGLTEAEALEKLKKIEEKAVVKSALKHSYRSQYIDYLRGGWKAEK